jgi:hypothetical protein
MPNYPNRCQHIKVNGTQCGSPALRRNRFCYFHKRHHEERIKLASEFQRNDRQKSARARRAVAIDMPVFEDGNSIQVSLMQITRLLISGAIDTKTAGLVLYALQTASSNLSRTSFNPKRHDVILDPAAASETLLGESIWEDEDYEEEIDDEDDEEEEEEIDAAKEAGIRKTAEFLYDLDHKNAAIRSATPKPVPAPVAKPDVKAKKAPASESSAAEIREQIRQQIVNAAPALRAANPSLLRSPSKESPA